MNNDPMPTLNSMSEFEVGKNARGQYEVRFTLTSSAEKDAWLSFLTKQNCDYGCDDDIEITIL